MKTKLTFFLMLVFIMHSFSTFAAEPMAAEDAAAVAKARLEIPDYYTDFYGRVSQTDFGTTYDLSWSGNGDAQNPGGNASATLDEKGRVIYYSHFQYGKYEGDYKLSTLDRNGAAAIAAASVARICPEFAGSMRIVDEPNYYERNSGRYYIRFYRYENNIPYFGNYITAVIDAHSKTLSELDVRWDDLSGFRSGEGVIDPQTARAKYLENIGVSLFYSDDSSRSVILMYGANRTAAEYISAFTGEVTRTGISGGNYAVYAPDYSTVADNAVNYDDIVTWDDTAFSEAYEITAREKPGIPDGYAVAAASLVGTASGDSYYNIPFISSGQETINVAIDAKTKEILSYNKTSENAAAGREVSETEAYVIAKAFAQNMTVKFAACADSQKTGRLSFYGSGGYEYTFTFPRLVNGLTYAGDGIKVSVSASGGVTSYRCTWSKRVFPSAAEVVPAGDAADELFLRAGFAVQYAAVAKPGVRTPHSAKDIEIRLVYGFAPGKPVFVNARTGKLCDTSGESYRDGRASVSAGIADHPSGVSIAVLQSSGILPEEEAFRPDENITQLEYLSWIYRATSQYAPDDTESVYNAMIYHYNVLTEAERSDAAEITFEQAVRYLIRLLGYTDVAELADTYVTRFFDETAIDPENIGYAAIAQGLGIVKGNAFTPKRIVTRATAAEIIYNLATS